MIKAVTLKATSAIHVMAKFTFTTNQGEKRNAGDQWLVTKEQAEVFIPNVHEEVVANIEMISLNSRQYCYIENPVNKEGKN